MKDVLGNEIQIGDRVVTSQHQGSHGWLNVYPVIGYENGCPVLQGIRGEGIKFRLVYKRSEDAIAVVEKAKPEGIICDQDQVCRPSDRCAEHSSKQHDPGDEDATEGFPNRRSLAW